MSFLFYRSTAGPDAEARRQRGMTLLELLVALSIFAVVGTALYPVINGTLSSRRDATEKVALAAEARLIVDRIEQDVLGNLDAGFPGPYPQRFVAPAPSGQRGDSERNVLEVTSLLARGVTATEAFVDGEDIAALSVDRGDQAQVLWRIDSSGQLLRQELRPPATQFIDWRNVPAEVFSEHASVILEFYEQGSWLEAWDSSQSGSQQKRAPVAVRTTVSVTDDNNSQLELVSTVVLPVVETADIGRGGRGARP